MAASITENLHMLENASDSELEEDDDFSDDGFDADEEEILNDAVEGGEDEREDEGQDGSKQGPQHGLANVMTKILQKKIPSNKVILAKALTDKQLEKRKIEAQDEEDGNKKLKTEKDEDKTSNTYISQQEKVKQWENLCRVKPDPLNKNRERQLQRIATRGVVQLFNAVQKQQKIVEEQVKKVKTEKKKEQVLADMNKNTFLDILKGTSSSNVLKGQNQKKIKTEVKEEKIDESERKWNILRDDYMMGAKMKDWNKSSSDDDDDDDDAEPPDPNVSDND